MPRKSKKTVTNYREELKQSKVVEKLSKTPSKRKTRCITTTSEKKPRKRAARGSKKQEKIEIITDTIEEFKETQYYNEFDEEVTTKSKIYDQFTLRIETDGKTGKRKYYCTIDCVYPNKKQKFNREVTTSSEVMWFFGNCTAVKKLYKKTKFLIKD